MSDRLSRAWQLVSINDTKRCNESFDTAMRIANDTSASREERADAMFLLGQIERHFQPQRSEDEGTHWFDDAITIFPDHLDSVLARCEIALQLHGQDDATLQHLLSRVPAIESQMTPFQREQWAMILSKLNT